MDATPLTDALMDQTPAAAMTDAPPLLEARDISKYFGAVVALEGVSLMVRPGQVTCLLGDNGAGKSTLIKTLSGVHRPDKGTLAVDGQPVEFGSPRDALDAGIATVYQDLSVMPLMSVTRNFFLGNEPTKGVGPLKRFDLPKAAAKPMMAQGKGAIVNISSGASLLAMPQAAPYGAAKAALIFNTERWALEFVPHGIRVNTVSPGSILVPGNGWDRYRQASQTNFDDYVRHGFPMGRLGTAEEVADVIAFLASPRAHWINGRNIAVDGLEQPYAPADRRPF